METENLEFCAECGGQIINSGFEMTCSHCGIVVSDLRLKPEYIYESWNATNDRSAKQYVSFGQNCDMIGILATNIGKNEMETLRDYKGRVLNPETQKSFKRMIKYYQKNSGLKHHESEYRILKQIILACSYLEVGKQIQENACKTFIKIARVERTLKNRVVIGAACLLMAIKESDTHAPISIQEIVDVYSNMAHRMTERLIMRVFLTYPKYFKKKFNPKKSEDYLIRMVNQLVNEKRIEQWILSFGYSKEEYALLLIKKSQEILEKVNVCSRAGRNPMILTAAVIYCSDKIIAREHGHRTILTQKSASEAMRVAEYSIRDHFVKLLKTYFVG